MHPDIAKLLDLQARDIELLHLDQRFHQLNSEIADLDAEVNRAREKIAQAERDIAVETRRRDELEAKIESHRKHQDKRREKLEFMKTPKEVASLMAEIDLARGILSSEENEWVKSSEQVSQHEMKRADAVAQAAEIEKSQAGARAEAAERRLALEAERQAILVRREASAREVRKPLLQQYDKLRASANSRVEVVVALSGPACGACFTTVPVSRRGQIKSGTVIEGCENCGVILYSAE